MPDLSVRFWGVRGTIPCPGPETLRYGGNTSCLEVMCGKHSLIFDAGSGIRRLGNLANGNGRDSFEIFLTHTHLDHIIGLPFFSPAFHPENKINIHAAHLPPEQDLRDVISRVMQDPLLPISVDTFQANVSFHRFTQGEMLEPFHGVKLSSCRLNHPNGATGYRVDYKGHSVCFITDHEHRPGELDKAVLALVKDSDVMIYDATYTDAEYPNYKGWGHSTWQEAIKLGRAANVGKVVLFHHDPSRTDEQMDLIASEAEAARAGTMVAREGLILYL